jgi:ATP-dependent DNA helicase RecG
MCIQSLLNDLETPMTRLSWVRPATAKKLLRLGIVTMFDLLKHLPSGCLYRRFVQEIGEAAPSELVVVRLRVIRHVQREQVHQQQHFVKKQQTSIQKQPPYIIETLSGHQRVRLVFFNIPGQSYMQQAYKIGSFVTITGRLELFQGIPSFIHPELFGASREQRNCDGIEPVYPLTAGMTLPMMQGLIRQALAHCPELPEWIAPSTQRLLKIPGWKQALEIIHHPKSEEDIHPLHPARQRLAFDELLANQLALLSVRRVQKHRRGRVFGPSQYLRQAFLANLSFELTGDQQRAIAEIDADLASPEPMMRLLQGDVGSGKTVVAMVAMLNVIEGGAQAALMAPTEILARQHAHTVMRWAEQLGVKAALLTGRHKGKARNQMVQAIQAGEIQLIIGTHALIQEDIMFKDLGLAVIDEQHRFGVEQRLQLVEKGNGVNVLSMTATPIPRTLMLTCYGDLDCSYIREKPAFRQPIHTRLCSLKRIEEVIEGIGRALVQGHKIYWVCPLVEESEVVDLAAAEERFQRLSTLFPQRVGLLHGRMKEAQKVEMMERFRQGEIHILVATTVIEVGVDVPDATMMIIEHAERFGLAQLHQLRGRVGRGHRTGLCMLLYHSALTPVARSRLRIMRETNDGFRIAEEDLRLRGGGELTGLRQSGLSPFVFADVMIHQDLLRLAQREGQDFLQQDPYFLSPRGKAMKTLLHLFNKQASLRFLSAV